jgi:sugar lactone lactonase YvrE
MLERGATRQALVIATLVSACGGATSAGTSGTATTTFPQAEEPIPSQVELVLSIKGDPNPLNGPSDLAIGPSGELYVVDTLNGRVQVFDSFGVFVRMWGSAGDGIGQFNFVGGGDGFGAIDVDQQGNVFVTDWVNRRVQRFDQDGRFITSWGAVDAAGTQFFSIASGLAVDRDGNVYVSDYERQKVFKFNREGTLLISWGERGAGEGQLNSPFYVFVASDDSVYVADLGNNRIQRFDSQGQFLSILGTSGNGDGQFSSPSDIALDAQGNRYVSDWDNHRIQVFDQSGRFLYKWGSFGSGDYEFNEPRAVVVDTEGRIYVADYFNDRVQVFERR